jgi:hypothetical protein
MRLRWSHGAVNGAVNVSNDAADISTPPTRDHAAPRHHHTSALSFFASSLTGPCVPAPFPLPLPGTQSAPSPRLSPYSANIFVPVSFPCNFKSCAPRHNNFVVPSICSPSFNHSAVSLFCPTKTHIFLCIPLDVQQYRGRRSWKCLEDSPGKEMVHFQAQM